MNDEEDRRAGDLVPYVGGEIVSRSTSLVRRGLSHLEHQKPAAQLLRVVVGDHETNLGAHLVGFIERSGAYEVVPVFITEADSLANHAHQEGADLFVLIVNNLSCYASDPQLIPELIAILKTPGQTPIIALSGDSSMPSDLRERILRAGADVLLDLPVVSADFEAVVRDVLSRAKVGSCALRTPDSNSPILRSKEVCS